MNGDKSEPRPRSGTDIGATNIGASISGGDEAQRAAIRKALAAVSEVEVVADEGRLGHGAARAAAVHIVMFVASGESHQWGAELDDLIDSEPQAAVVALLDDRSGDAVRLALRAGAADVLFLPLEQADLTRCLVKISEQHDGVGSVKRNHVASFVSIAGGSGVSTVVTALGLAIGRLSGKKVALIDLALQCNTLALLLRVQPEHTISELADPTSVIDSIRLESALCVHQSGLHLLAAPKRIEEAELVSTGTIAATVDIMRELFDFVLIDCGHHVNEGSVAAWERCDEVFYVVEQSVASIWCAQRFVNLFDRLNLKRVRLRFLLNRFNADNAIKLGQIETALHRRIEVTVARDDLAFARAQIEAADLSVVAAHSEARRAIDELAKRICGIPNSPDLRVRNGLLSAMRSVVGLG